MNDGSDRKELERRLEQARRTIYGIIDPITIERLIRLIRDLEEQLRWAPSVVGL
jgi:hypothetical protein